MKLQTVSITNTGYASCNITDMVMPEAIPFVKVASEIVGEVKIGETKKFDLVLSFSSVLQLKLYQDRIIIKSSNYQDIPTYLAVHLTAEEVGSIRFKVLDQIIYKAFKVQM